MFARGVLPLLGGAPSVWTACMLFFQTALLAGYWYAHATVRWLGVRRQSVLHLPVLLGVLALLPVHAAGPPPGTGELDPVWWLLRLMVATVGGPFFVLATTAPLLQRWFASAVDSDPYFLYAASNLGSIVALLAYPTFIEPSLPLTAQERWWAAGYLIAAALIVACAWLLHRAPPHQTGAGSAQRLDPPRLVQRLHWIALAFVPSSLMLAVTMYLSTDVAAVPLLWTVPLTIYLATFVVAFGARVRRRQAAAARLLPLGLLPLIMLWMLQAESRLWFALPLHLTTFAAVAMVCHQRLADLRPEASQLTSFYLCVAIGGTFGGLLNSVIAPTLFTGIWEYPLMLAAACFLLAGWRETMAPLQQPRLLVRPLLAAVTAAAALIAASWGRLEPAVVLPLLGIPALLAFSVSRRPGPFAYAVAALLIVGASAAPSPWGRVLYAERTFFGVYRIAEDTGGQYTTLFHGTTVHGRQARGSRRSEPLTYYHPGSPVADVLRTRAQGARSVGVVGLGVGSLAAYARDGEQWTFYEIDPAVERIARDSRYFTYLSGCRVCRVVIGDARISLEAGDEQYDVLVLDAFTSDAIPVHLLTTEALAVYAARLKPDGVLAVHISNRHVALRPVLAALARERGWPAIARFDDRASQEAGHSRSDWVAIGPNSGTAKLMTTPRWTVVDAGDTPAWSDDFANIWAVLRWK